MDKGATLIVFDCGGVLGGVDLLSMGIKLAQVLNVTILDLQSNPQIREILANFETGRIQTAAMLNSLREEFGSEANDLDLIEAINAAVLPQFLYLKYSTRVR